MARSVLDRLRDRSVAYSLATALVGVFTPAIATYPIQVTNDRAVPGAWLSLAAALGLSATLLLARDRAGVARGELASRA